MADYYKDLTGILRAAGCWKVREGKGSHEIWCSPINNQTFSVPRTSKSRHTANEVLRQAGLAKEF